MAEVPRDESFAGSLEAEPQQQEQPQSSRRGWFRRLTSRSSSASRRKSNAAAPPLATPLPGIQPQTSFVTADDRPARFPPPPSYVLAVTRPSPDDSIGLRFRPGGGLVVMSVLPGQAADRCGGGWATGRALRRVDAAVVSTLPELAAALQGRVSFTLSFDESAATADEVALPAGAAAHGLGFDGCTLTSVAQGSAGAIAGAELFVGRAVECVNGAAVQQRQQLLDALSPTRGGAKLLRFEPHPFSLGSPAAVSPTQASSSAAPATPARQQKQSWFSRLTGRKSRSASMSPSQPSAPASPMPESPPFRPAAPHGSPDGFEVESCSGSEAAGEETWLPLTPEEEERFQSLRIRRHGYAGAQPLTPEEQAELAGLEELYDMHALEDMERVKWWRDVGMKSERLRLRHCLVTKDARGLLGIGFNARTMEVTSLVPGGSAEKAGVRIGMRVLTMSGQPVPGAREYKEVLAGSQQTLEIGLLTVDEPSHSGSPEPQRGPPPTFETYIVRADPHRSLGLRFSEGLVVSEVVAGEACARCGGEWAAGHVVTHVDGESVTSLAELCAAVRNRTDVTVRFSSAPASADTLSYSAAAGDPGLQFDGPRLVSVQPGSVGEQVGARRMVGRRLTHLCGESLPPGLPGDEAVAAAGSAAATVVLTFAPRTPLPQRPVLHAAWRRLVSDSIDSGNDAALLKRIQQHGERESEEEHMKVWTDLVRASACGDVVSSVAGGEGMSRLYERLRQAESEASTEADAQSMSPKGDLPPPPAPASHKINVDRAGGEGLGLLLRPGGGCVVLAVAPGGACARAGGAWMVGRAVTHVDGDEVQAAEELRAAISAAGASVELTLDKVAAAGDEVLVRRASLDEHLGITLDPSMHVIGVTTESAAARGGAELMQGRCLTHADGEPVGTTADLSRVAANRASLLLRFHGERSAFERVAMAVSAGTSVDGPDPSEPLSAIVSAMLSLQQALEEQCRSLAEEDSAASFSQSPQQHKRGLLSRLTARKGKEAKDEAGRRLSATPQPRRTQSRSTEPASPESHDDDRHTVAGSDAVSAYSDDVGAVSPEGSARGDAAVKKSWLGRIMGRGSPKSQHGAQAAPAAAAAALSIAAICDHRHLSPQSSQIFDTVSSGGMSAHHAEALSLSQAAKSTLIDITKVDSVMPTLSKPRSSFRWKAAGGSVISEHSAVTPHHDDDVRHVSFDASRAGPAPTPRQRQHLHDKTELVVTRHSSAEVLGLKCAPGGGTFVTEVLPGGAVARCGGSWAAGRAVTHVDGTPVARLDSMQAETRGKLRVVLRFDTVAAAENEIVVRRTDDMSAPLGLQLSDDLVLISVDADSLADLAGARAMVGRKVTHVAWAEVSTVADYEQLSQGTEHCVVRFALPDLQFSFVGAQTVCADPRMLPQSPVHLTPPPASLPSLAKPDDEHEQHVRTRTATDEGPASPPYRSISFCSSPAARTSASVYSSFGSRKVNAEWIQRRKSLPAPPQAPSALELRICRDSPSERLGLRFLPGGSAVVLEVLEGELCAKAGAVWAVGRAVTHVDDDVVQGLADLGRKLQGRTDFRLRFGREAASADQVIIYLPPAGESLGLELDDELTASRIRPDSAAAFAGVGLMLGCRLLSANSTPVTSSEHLNALTQAAAAAGCSLVLEFDSSVPEPRGSSRESLSASLLKDWDKSHGHHDARDDAASQVGDDCRAADQDLLSAGLEPAKPARRGLLRRLMNRRGSGTSPRAKHLDTRERRGSVTSEQPAPAAAPAEVEAAAAAAVTVAVLSAPEQLDHHKQRQKEKGSAFHKLKDMLTKHGKHAQQSPHRTGADFELHIRRHSDKERLGLRFRSGGGVVVDGLVDGEPAHRCGGQWCVGRRTLRVDDTPVRCLADITAAIQGKLDFVMQFDDPPAAPDEVLIWRTAADEPVGAEWVTGPEGLVLKAVTEGSAACLAGASVFLRRLLLQAGMRAVMTLEELEREADAAECLSLKFAPAAATPSAPPPTVWLQKSEQSGRYRTELDEQTAVRAIEAAHYAFTLRQTAVHSRNAEIADALRRKREECRHREWERREAAAEERRALLEKDLAELRARLDQPRSRARTLSTVSLSPPRPRLDPVAAGTTSPEAAHEEPSDTAARAEAVSEEAAREAATREEAAALKDAIARAEAARAEAARAEVRAEAARAAALSEAEAARAEAARAELRAEEARAEAARAEAARVEAAHAEAARLEAARAEAAHAARAEAARAEAARVEAARAEAARAEAVRAEAARVEAVRAEARAEAARADARAEAVARTEAVRVNAAAEPARIEAGRAEAVRTDAAASMPSAVPRPQPAETRPPPTAPPPPPSTPPPPAATRNAAAAAPGTEAGATSVSAALAMAAARANARVTAAAAAEAAAAAVLPLLPHSPAASSGTKQSPDAGARTPSPDVFDITMPSPPPRPLNWQLRIAAVAAAVALAAAATEKDKRLKKRPQRAVRAPPHLLASSTPLSKPLPGTPRNGPVGEQPAPAILSISMSSDHASSVPSPRHDQLPRITSQGALTESARSDLPVLQLSPTWSPKSPAPGQQALPLSRLTSAHSDHVAPDERRLSASGLQPFQPLSRLPSGCSEGPPISEPRPQCAPLSGSFHLSPRSSPVQQHTTGRLPEASTEPILLAPAPDVPDAFEVDHSGPLVPASTEPAPEDAAPVMGMPDPNESAPPSSLQPLPSPAAAAAVQWPAPPSQPDGKPLLDMLAALTPKSPSEPPAESPPDGSAPVLRSPPAAPATSLATGTVSSGGTPAAAPAPPQPLSPAVHPPPCPPPPPDTPPIASATPPPPSPPPDADLSPPPTTRQPDLQPVRAPPPLSSPGIESQRVVESPLVLVSSLSTRQRANAGRSSTHTARFSSSSSAPQVVLLGRAQNESPRGMHHESLRGVQLLASACSPPRRPETRQAAAAATAATLLVCSCWSPRRRRTLSAIAASPPPTGDEGAAPLATSATCPEPSLRADTAAGRSLRSDPAGTSLQSDRAGLSLHSDGGPSLHSDPTGTSLHALCRQLDTRLARARGARGVPARATSPPQRRMPAPSERPMLGPGLRVVDKRRGEGRIADAFKPTAACDECLRGWWWVCFDTGKRALCPPSDLSPAPVVAAALVTSHQRRRHA